MTLTSVKRNAMRQIGQIWDYIESQLKSKQDVSPGVIFPRQPKDPNRRKLIEQLFNEKGIAVVWEDEPVTGKKPRC